MTSHAILAPIGSDMGMANTRKVAKGMIRIEILIQGRYLPPFRWIFSSRKPKMGSLMASPALMARDTPAKIRAEIPASSA